MTTQVVATGYTAVAKMGALASGAMTAVNAGGKDVLLARVGDKYYAASNVCPHMGGRLSAGKLDGAIVTCPRHHSRFDLTDGHNMRWTDWTGAKLYFAKILRPPRALKTYPVKVEGDNIMVKVED